MIRYVNQRMFNFTRWVVKKFNVNDVSLVSVDFNSKFIKSYDTDYNSYWNNNTEELLVTDDKKTNKNNKLSSDANALRTQSEGNAPNTHNTLPITQDTSIGAVAPAKKASRMTEEWQLPKAWGEWAVAEHNLSVETVRLEANKFRDYWLAKAGNWSGWSATR